MVTGPVMGPQARGALTRRTTARGGVKGGVAGSSGTLTRVVVLAPVAVASLGRLCAVMEASFLPAPCCGLSSLASACLFPYR